MNDLIGECGGLRIINAVGYATRVGGSCPVPEVLEAMQWAQGHYFEIDDLLEHASGVIARLTGSEAGIVTCGASAALTLGAAAILAGDDVAIMEALPETAGMARRTFLFPAAHPFDYDHPLRASGAQLRDFDFSGDGLEERLAAALAAGDVAGAVCVWKHRNDGEGIARVAAVCRKAGLPLLLDAAMGLPPSENLREFMAWKPHLVALSGGKHLGGPQNSGLLFGEASLVRSAWLQMVDMDVRPSSWSQIRLLEQGILAQPPRHGIGRGLKVGKDAILGCLAALERYPHRDFAGERAQWFAICETIAKSIGINERFQVEVLPENATGQYPVIRITAVSADHMNRLKVALKSQSPKIILAEDETNEAVASIYPMCLTDADIAVLIGRMTSALAHEI